MNQVLRSLQSSWGAKTNIFNKNLQYKRAYFESNTYVMHMARAP